VLRSLANTMHADTGFAPDHLLTLDVTIPPTKYTEPDFS
jgi:hypothetical protein